MILVAILSERSNNCLRDDIGINKVVAPFSTANSATATGFGINSIEPPRFSAPTIIIPPLALLSINPPQSAILGMHNIVERPVVLQGEVVIRPIMYVALSYDHRIIDGKESVGFLVAVKEALENPVEILMNNDAKKALEL